MCAIPRDGIPKTEAVAKAMLIIHEMAKLGMISHKDKDRCLDAMGEIGRSNVLHFDRDDFKSCLDGKGDEMIVVRQAEADARLAERQAKQDQLDAEWHQRLVTGAAEKEMDDHRRDIAEFLARGGNVKGGNNV